MRLSIKKDWLITLIIILLALFFRLYRLGELFPFTMDEEYQAFIVERIIKKTHFPLIGVNVANTGLYLGPLFSYFASIVYLIFQKNILGWAITASTIGGLTTLYLIKVGQKLIGKTEGWLAGLLYATSFLTVSYDRKLWNASFIPFLSILLILGILNVKKEPRYWLLMFFILGLGFHTHFSILLFWPILIWWIFKERVKIKNKSFFKGILIFFFLLSPLILFEFRHNFLQTKALINLIDGRNYNIFSKKIFPNKVLGLVKTGARLILVPGSHNLATEMNVCQKINKSTPFLGFSLLIPISLLFLWKKKLDEDRRKFLQLILGIFLIFVLGFLFSPLSPSEYYLLPLFPLTFLIMGWVTELIFLKSNQFLKIFALLFLIFVLSFNVWSNLDSKNSFGLETKRMAILWSLKKVNKEPYFLDSLGDCYKYEGYRYLFEKLGQAPVASFMDPYFSWAYSEDKKPTSNYEKKVVIFNNTPEISEKEKKTWEEEIMGVTHEKITGDFGLIKVLIKSK